MAAEFEHRLTTVEVTQFFQAEQLREVRSIIDSAREGVWRLLMGVALVLAAFGSHVVLGKIGL
jgi:hypothetical protein